MVVLFRFEVQVDHFLHRVLLEEDALGSLDASNKLLHASAGARGRLYKEGDFTKSKISSFDIYLLKKVLINLIALSELCEKV